MCQSGCSYENCWGDCTHEENRGLCPLYMKEQENKKVIWLNEHLVEGQHKCIDCMFSQLCDVLTDNYKQDICQVIQEKFENLEGE